MSLRKYLDPKLGDALTREPLKSALHAFFEKVRQFEMEQLVRTPPDADHRVTQGRAQILTELKDLVK